MQKMILGIALVMMAGGLLSAQQYITGTFPAHARQSVTLSVYEGFQRRQVSETTADSLGNFRVTCPAGYRGVVFLQANKAEGIEVIVMQDNSFSLKGTSLLDIDNLICMDNPATTTLYSYYKQQVAREKALAGWKYLERVYSDDAYLKKYNKVPMLAQESGALEKEGTDFIKSQSTGSYVGWYLPLISFVRDIPVSIQRYPERIPVHMQQFMHVDFSDGWLYRSGLLPVLMENYYFMLENMGRPLDSIYVEMNKATDYIVNNLKDKRPEWLQETSLFLFNLFERRSLFTAAEHLSEVMLTQNACVLDGKVSARFEGYRSMKKGNRAPDIDFGRALSAQKTKGDDMLAKYLKGYKSLSALPGKYKLVVFGFNECPECATQLPQLKQMYPALQQQGVEVVYVSLDTDKSKFEAVAADKPWVSYFDYEGWESRPVAGYYVFASPTMFLLGAKQEILYKVISPQHLEAILKMLSSTPASSGTDRK